MANETAKIFSQLKKSGFKIFGPKEQDSELHILELEKIPPAPPFQGGEKYIWPWKYFFTPPRETILKFGKKVEAPKFSKEKIALFGMGLFDCKALELYDKVFGTPLFKKEGRGEIFEGDLYYQQNRKNIFVVGFSSAPLEALKISPLTGPVPLTKIKTPFFEVDLASIIFDIFIESLPVSSRAKSRDLNFYAQGKYGEEILKKCGIKYKVIKYSPRKADKKVLAIKKAMEAGKDSKMWDELGEICLACGKCTIACPTCYCFDLESALGPECKTERCSGNCFYDDFTRIAGPPAKAGEPSGHKFLNNPKEKIYFWYYHKFVRIPHGYGLPGCTDCGRCSAVCPVGIDIRKNIERLLKEAKK